MDKNRDFSAKNILEIKAFSMHANHSPKKIALIYQCIMYSDNPIENNKNNNKILQIDIELSEKWKLLHGKVIKYLN